MVLLRCSQTVDVICFWTLFSLFSSFLAVVFPTSVTCDVMMMSYTTPVGGGGPVVVGYTSGVERFVLSSDLCDLSSNSLARCSTSSDT